MKIGVVVDNTFDNDPRVQHEVNSLRALGHNVHVLCYKNGQEKDYIHRVSQGIDFKKKWFPLMNTFPIYQDYWSRQIKSFIAEFKPDILHVHDLYMSGIARKATIGKIPFILDLHENFPATIQTYTWANKGIKKWLVQPKKWIRKEGKLLNKANKIITLSEDFKTLLLNRYNFLDSTNIFVVPNYPDLSKIKLANRIDDDDFRLFYFGVIGKRRGIDIVLKALPELAKCVPNIKFKLIGPIDKNDQEYFKGLMENQQINNHLEYSPWIKTEELTSATENVDVCVCPIEKNPQHESGVANKVYQYLAMGKPQIVSNCKPQMELINKENCGLIFEDKDIPDFVEKVELLFKSPSLLNELKENSLKASKKYGETEFQQLLMKVYSSL
jgi:glycosyltransferase involved in cell wall biosynthesis